MELRNKTVVITGSTSGLGKVMAEILLQFGANVVINGLTQSEVDTAASELGVYGAVADVSKENEVESLAIKVVAKYGRIDVWINNAGIWMPYEQMENIPVDRLKQLMDVNFYGTWYGCRSALKHMKPQNGGIIVNILSVRPLEPKAGSAAYSASKAAAIGLTKTLQLENANSSVAVISVCPGPIKTKLFDEQPPADYDQYMEATFVAEKIIENIAKDEPESQQIIKKDSV